MELPSWTQEPGRVAIVHDWLTGMRGGEAILDVLCEQFPKADLYTLLQTDFEMSPNILNGRNIHHSYLQKLMGMRRFKNGYRTLLPLFPHALGTFHLEGYDLVLSNSHCVAKGVKVSGQGLHVSYISTPMRYIWDAFDEYFGPGRSSKITALAATLLRPYFQHWDTSTNQGVDYFIANSNFVRDRIKKFWGRDSTVIHPFVDTKNFSDQFADPKDYYLVLSAFAPNKRIDLAIEAFKLLGKRLLIIGKGQDEKKLKELAKGYSNIEFLGSVSTESLGEFYRKARALVLPGLEDFGITPLESLYCGRPVIAYGKGGYLDSITPETGVFFYEQTPQSLAEAVSSFEKLHFQSEVARARSLEFSREVFTRKIMAFLGESLERKTIEGKFRLQTSNQK